MYTLLGCIIQANATFDLLLLFMTQLLVVLLIGGLPVGKPF